MQFGRAPDPAMQSTIDGCQNKRGVSIVIPAYNEEHGLGLLLPQLDEVLAVSGLPWEIVVIDDGSTDDTAEVARQFGVTLICRGNNRGYGAALKTGIRHACYEIIVITDADDTYPSDCIPQLLATFQDGQYDMVVGARTGEQVAVSLIRLPAKWALTRLAEFVARQRIPDLNSGLRIFHRSTVLQFWNFLPDGFSFTTTITLAMLSNGYLVTYVPINYRVRIGQSKIRPVHDTVGLVDLILRTALYFTPLRIFMPISGLLLFVGLLWGLYTYLVLGQLADVSTLIIVMSALQIGALGLLAELLNKRATNLSGK